MFVDVVSSHKCLILRRQSGVQFDFILLVKNGRLTDLKGEAVENGCCFHIYGAHVSLPTLFVCVAYCKHMLCISACRRSGNSCSCDQSGWWNSDVFYSCVNNWWPKGFNCRMKCKDATDSLLLLSFFTQQLLNFFLTFASHLRIAQRTVSGYKMDFFFRSRNETHNQSVLLSTVVS